MRLLLLLFLHAITTIILSYEYTGYDECNSQIECSACISHSPQCMWCRDEGLEKTERCRTYNENDDSCSLITFPKGDEVANAKTPIPFGNTTDKGEVVQIVPQKFQAQVRKGGSVSFDVTVRPAKDYPLDLYFLMDLSNSMEKTLDVLKDSVSEMSNQLKILTNNHRIGFGTFVDKTTAPFIYTSPARKLNPCYKVDDKGNVVQSCEPAYNFNNTVSLNEYESFDRLITASKVSASVDKPEAGMDALMQVASCLEPIGWRNHSRKVIVYLTDTGFHFAGDGKLGGQIERNDGKCWILDDRTYSKEQILDYPSIHQVVKRMVENKMIPIFGVKPEIEPLYRDLKALFPFGEIGILSEGSNNLVELIVENYRSISSAITPRLTSQIEGVTVEHVAKCPATGYKDEKGGSCSKVGIEQEAHFTFTVTMDQCLTGNETMVIEFAGFGQLEVDLSTLCDCQCDSVIEDGPEICNGNGEFRCGSCACDPGWTGEVCDCPEGDEGMVDLCKAPGSERICSSNGKCECGKCVCEGDNYGDFCQCNNNNPGCECGGRGECVCPANSTSEVCKCPPGWSGDDCECPDSTEQCMFNSEVCNGKGDCVCGKCVCHKAADAQNQWSGDHCSKCAYCDYCDDFEKCVACVVGTEDEAGRTPEQCPDCTGVAQRTEFTTAQKEDVEERDCEYVVGDCIYFYYYAQDPQQPNNTRLILYINNEPDCGPIDVIWIIVGLILAIVLLGIIIICCWKCITMYKDKKEYKKFMEDMEKTKFAHTMSPLYNSPITKVENPIAKKM